MALSVTETFDDLFSLDEKINFYFWKSFFLSAESKLLDALITDNESIGFAKLVEVVAHYLQLKY